jgi:uncharacterized protein (DUF1697 family)
MTRFIAFLRAINVGGHNVKMEELRGHFEALGFKDVETFIASGNVIFASSSKDAAAVERKIEDRLIKSLGYAVRTFIRTEAELMAVARYRPFKASQLQAGMLNVGFLAQPLTADARKSLMALKTEIDDFHVNGREVYWLCRKKQSESTFSNMRFEKVVKASATFRGVNTVTRLAARHLTSGPSRAAPQ